MLSENESVHTRSQGIALTCKRSCVTSGNICTAIVLVLVEGVSSGSRFLAFVLRSNRLLEHRLRLRLEDRLTTRTHFAFTATVSYDERQTGRGGIRLVADAFAVGRAAR